MEPMPTYQPSDDDDTRLVVSTRLALQWGITVGRRDPVRAPLHYWLKHARMSQRKLAGLLGIAQQSVSHWVKGGAVMPKYVGALLLVTQGELSVADILYWDDPEYHAAVRRVERGL